MSFTLGKPSLLLREKPNNLSYDRFIHRRISMNIKPFSHIRVNTIRLKLKKKALLPMLFSLHYVRPHVDVRPSDEYVDPDKDQI